MKDQLISFDVAKLAKEKGFNHVFYGMYRGQDTYWTNDGTKCVCGFDEELDEWKDEVERIYKWLTPRPTQSLLQKWLREVHNIEFDIVVTKIGENKKSYDIFIIDTSRVEVKQNKKVIYSFFNFKNYEEVLEMGLQEGLKIIK